MKYYVQYKDPQVGKWFVREVADTDEDIDNFELADILMDTIEELEQKGIRGTIIAEENIKELIKLYSEL